MYPLPPLPVKKMPRPAHRKSDAIKDLEAMAFEEACRQHPSVDRRYIAPRAYKDSSANGLTRAIIDYLRLSGCQAERINCTGRPIDGTIVFENVLGDLRKIGSTTWLPTSGQRGTSDISATIRGRSVKIEVKMKDRQSEDQKRYQKAIEFAGGLYWLVKSLEEFRQMYDTLINNMEAPSRVALTRGPE